MTKLKCRYRRYGEVEMDMKLEEALERIKKLERRIPSFVKNWNITKNGNQVEDRNTMPNGWKFIMILWLHMRVA